MAGSQGNPLILGYWNIKGIVESIRWLLHYLNVPFIEENPKDWDNYLALRKERGLDFPNLPYLIDGDFKLTESKAVLLYIAEKYKPELLGKNQKDQVTVRMISGVLSDVVSPYANHIGDTSGQKQAIEKEVQLRKVDDKLKYLSQFLGQKEFLLGYLTVSDFELSTIAYRVWAYSRTHDVSNPFENYENINKLIARVRSLPGVIDYISSSAGTRPIHTPGYLPVTIKED